MIIRLTIVSHIDMFYNKCYDMFLYNTECVYFFFFFFRYTIKTSVDAEDVKDSTPTLSHRAIDLKMGVTSFCKAFPWHLVLDQRLEFVQLGNGFMKLFGKCLQQFGECDNGVIIKSMHVT